jgi:two-component system OmpR family sensor kinase
MRGDVARKWRPPLGLVVGAALALAVAAPIAAVLLAALARHGAEREAGIWVGVAVAAAGAGLLALVLRRAILRPVSELAARATAIQAGDAGALAGQRHYGTREIGRLGQCVLDMARTLHGREAAIRSYTDHVTHELKAPIAAIRGAAELLQDPDLPGPDRDRLTGAIDDAAGRLDQLLEAARALAAAREPRHVGSCRLGDLLAGLRAEAPGLKITARGEAVRLPLGCAGLAVVLGHLARNAAQHGARHLWIDAASAPSGAVLGLRDDGPGISSGNRARVFEPFFSTRRSEAGAGMGLAIVHTLLAAHGADIALDPGGPGTGFTIRFSGDGTAQGL